MSINIKEWAFLWDGSEPGWVLINLGSMDKKEYSIFNIIHNYGMLAEIEDDDYNYLIQLMIEKGVKKVDNYLDIIKNNENLLRN